MVLEKTCQKCKAKFAPRIDTQKFCIQCSFARKAASYLKTVPTLPDEEYEILCRADFDSSAIPKAVEIIRRRTAMVRQARFGAMEKQTAKTEAL